MTPMQAGFRVALFYGALFTGVGIHLPFWPLFLTDRGLTPAQIGLVTAATYAVRLVVNPIMGHVVDLKGERRRPMVVLAFAAAILWLGFLWTHDFGSVLMVTLVAVSLWAPIVPVGESLGLAVTQSHGVDYGRVRTWGSVAFILAAILTGRLMKISDSTWLVWLVSASLAGLGLACLFLPDDPGKTALSTRLPVAPLLKSPLFAMLLLTLAFNQASHAVYYAFASLHWKRAGIGDDVIGLLWSEGVVAEIILFLVSARLVAWAGPGRLLLMAAAGGVVRWFILGATTDLYWLGAAQALHAATFGCAHLGALYFLSRAIPHGLAVRAQSLVAAVAMGIAPAIMAPLAGRLFQSLDGGAFWVMSLLSLGAVAGAILLDRRWSGGLLPGLCASNSKG